MPLRVTDLVLAGAGARMHLFVPIAAIVFILVVPASEFVSPRSLQICDEGDPQGLIQYIKQHRSDGHVPWPATYVRQPQPHASCRCKRTHLCGDVSLSTH